MPETRKRIRELLSGLLESLGAGPGPPALRERPARDDDEIHLVLYPAASGAGTDGTDRSLPPEGEAPGDPRSWSEEVTVSGVPVRVRVLAREMSLPAGQRVTLVRASYAPDRTRRQRIGDFRLTLQEARVAVLLARRRTNREIARELGISPHTARHHTESVLRKLNVHTRREVAARLSTNDRT